MEEILTRAGSFVVIILLGYLLKRRGVFKKSDFDCLSMIVLKICLPGAIVQSFNGREIDVSLLSITALGFGLGVLYVVVALVINLKKDKGQRAFDVLNLPGYNIGNFTLPFVQSFLGPVGVVTTSLFDTGNAIICLGGTYGVATLIKDGSGFSVKRILRTLLRSVPFDTYLVMLALCLLGIRLPGPVEEFAGILSAASPFLAMLMLGVGFELMADREHIGFIVKYILIRYAVAAVVALCIYFLTTFSLEIRQTLVILVFSPFCSSGPPFTRELRGDVGLASAVNSVSILFSIVIIITLLSVML